MMPSRIATWVSSATDFTPSLRIRLARCVSTVRAPMSSVVGDLLGSTSPRAISFSTSRSRSVSAGQPLAPRPVTDQLGHLLLDRRAEVAAPADHRVDRRHQVLDRRILEQVAIGALRAPPAPRTPVRRASSARSTFSAGRRVLAAAATSMPSQPGIFRSSTSTSAPVAPHRVERRGAVGGLGHDFELRAAIRGCGGCRRAPACGRRRGAPAVGAALTTVPPIGNVAPRTRTPPPSPRADRQPCRRAPSPAPACRASPDCGRGAGGRPGPSSSTVSATRRALARDLRRAPAWRCAWRTMLVSASWTTR